MGLRTTADYGSFTLDATNEATEMQFAQDFRHIEIDLEASSVTSGFTLTVYASDQEDRPDLTSAASSTNRYAAVQVIDKNDGDPIDGTTGIVITADGFTRYEINENKARWVGIKMTARTDGTATIYYSFVDNQ